MDASGHNELSGSIVDVESGHFSSLESQAVTVEGQLHVVVTLLSYPVGNWIIYYRFVPSEGGGCEYIGLSDCGTFHDIKVSASVREESNGVESVVSTVDEGVCPALVCCCE